ncbi:MAG: hydrogenase maturation nickel metallochaperone HypA [Planctomycetia bacterium]|nr:hydrogenase maturation nickel metallochaperone HypA [Planctomycetia bacterium]
MHELSIALSLLDVAAEEAARRGLARVTAVHLKLGLLAGVVPAALRSAFELARADHVLAAAALVIEEVPITIYCPSCAAERPVASFPELVCPDCGTPAARVVHGRELEIVALECE